MSVIRYVLSEYVEYAMALSLYDKLEDGTFAGKLPLCGGNVKKGKTIFTVELGFGVVVVRDVSATVCSQCGADWIGDDIASRLEEIVDNARRNHRMVEVTTLAT
jgi:YgiT-type zinc finger domain-containing protein